MNKKIISIPKVLDDCVLCFIEGQNHIPFDIKRVYYILKADKKLPRGYHSHISTQQVLFCLQGSIELTLDDGQKRKKAILNKPDVGVFIDRMVWVEMHKFKKNTILLVLASKAFNPADYIRDYVKFKRLVNAKN